MPCLMGTQLARRLIEKHGAGGFAERRGELEQSPLERTQGLDRDVEKSLEPHALRGRTGVLLRLATVDRDPEPPRRTSDEQPLADRQLRRVKVAGQESCAATPIAQGGIVIAEPDRAAFLAAQSGQGLEQRRLPRIALSQDHVHGPGFHFKVEIAHKPARSIGHREALHPESGASPAHSRPPSHVPARPARELGSLQSRTIRVPAVPSKASRIFSGEVMKTEPPPLRTNSIAAWIFGPMLP